MLGAIKAWFLALSTVGKVSVLSAATVSGIAVTNSVQPTTPAAPQPCVPSYTYSTETVPIPFNRSTVDDPNTEKGKTIVRVSGETGEKTQTWKTTNFSPANCKPSARNLEKESVTREPVAEITAIGTKEPPTEPLDDCDPNYTPCVPNVSYDLDCGDIRFRVRVIGNDPNNFDADGDGLGCESYR